MKSSFNVSAGFTFAKWFLLYIISTYATDEHHHHHQHHHPNAWPTPYIYPTYKPTNAPTIDVDIDVEPGHEYDFGNGNIFKTADNLNVIKPYMIESCSSELEFINLYQDRVNNAHNFIINNPIVSETKNMDRMPDECVTICGNIKSIEVSHNIYHIHLSPIDIATIYESAEINIQNATLYEIIGENLTVINTDFDDNNSDIIAPNETYPVPGDHHLIHRRRLFDKKKTYKISWKPSEFTYSKIQGITFKSKPSAQASVSIRIRKKRRKPFLFQVIFSARALVDNRIIFDLWSGFDVKRRIIDWVKHFTIRIFGINIHIYPYFKIDVGPSLQFQGRLKFECKQTWGYSGQFGVEYMGGSGWKVINTVQKIREFECTAIDFSGQCAFTAKLWAKLESGVLIFRKKLLNVGTSLTFRSTLQIGGSEDLCRCNENNNKVTGDMQWFLFLNIRSFKIAGFTVPKSTVKTTTWKKKWDIFQSFCENLLKGITSWIARNCCSPRGVDINDGDHDHDLPIPDNEYPDIIPNIEYSDKSVVINNHISISIGSSSSSSSKYPTKSPTKYPTYGDHAHQPANHPTKFPTKYPTDGDHAHQPANQPTDQPTYQTTDSIDAFDINWDFNDKFINEKSNEFNKHISLSWMFVIIFGIIIIFMCYLKYNDHKQSIRNLNLIKQMSPPDDI